MTWKLKASTDAGSLTVFRGMARGISLGQTDLHKLAYTSGDQFVAASAWGSSVPRMKLPTYFLVGTHSA